MKRNLIRVDIKNKGKLFGLVTPAYNVPIDYETFELFKEMGFNICIHEDTPTVMKNVNKTQDIKPKKSTYRKKVFLELGDFVAEDHYDPEQLSTMTNAELARILNSRGHFSSKRGKRDPLAPKYDDTKPILINKILKTNLK